MGWNFLLFFELFASAHCIIVCQGKASAHSRCSMFIVTLLPSTTRRSSSPSSSETAASAPSSASSASLPTSDEELASWRNEVELNTQLFILWSQWGIRYDANSFPSLCSIGHHCLNLPWPLRWSVVAYVKCSGLRCQCDHLVHLPLGLGEPGHCKTNESERSCISKWKSVVLATVGLPEYIQRVISNVETGSSPATDLRIAEWH